MDATQRLFFRLYALAISIALGLGIAYGLGGARRFSSPSFDGLKNLASAVPWVPPYLLWAGVLVGYGGLLLIFLWRSGAVHVLRGGIVLYLFVAIGFIKSLANPAAAFGGVVIYIGLAVLHLLLSDYLARRGWDAR